jgi:hypothetical protein
MLTVEADSAWSGELRFDRPRHREILGLPADWPRINSYPEWFTVDAARSYRVRDAATGKATTVSGASLVRGLPVQVRARQRLELVVGSAPLPR